MERHCVKLNIASAVPFNVALSIDVTSGLGKLGTLELGMASLAMMKE